MTLRFRAEVAIPAARPWASPAGHSSDYVPVPVGLTTSSASVGSSTIRLEERLHTASSPKKRSLKHVYWQQVDPFFVVEQLFQKKKEKSASQKMSSFSLSMVAAVAPFTHGFSSLLCAPTLKKFSRGGF